MTAMYRIGPADTFTNADLEADAATLDRQIGQLDDADMTTVPQEWFDGWMSFRQAWKKFYSDVFLHSFFGPAWNDSNRDQLIAFENEFTTWAAQYASLTNKPLPGGVIQPSTGAQDNLGAQLSNQLRPLGATLSTYKWWVIGTVVVAGVFIFREPLVSLAKTAVGKVKT